MEGDDRQKDSEDTEEAERQGDPPPEATTTKGDQPKKPEVASEGWGERVGYGF